MRFNRILINPPVPAQFYPLSLLLSPLQFCGRNLSKDRLSGEQDKMSFQ
ncbi:MAG: hypothetical protein SPG70_03130 [Candidatus Cryptobacteroides sp.]|nr:hypothetical protein [Prevotella sp.]MDY5442363.1 hypothetical protein [Candidatus Cryptobacteroides sp.]